MSSKDNTGYTAGREVGTLALGVRKDTGATLATSDTFLTPMQFDSNGCLYVTSGGGSVSSAITSVIPGTAASNLGKAEDAAHTSGDVGVMALAVQKGTPADVSTEGDYAPLQISAGRLWVSSSVTAVVPGTAASSLGKAEDDAHNSGDVGVMSLAVQKATPVNLGADGDYGPFQVSAGRLWTSATLDTETVGTIGGTGSNLDIDASAEVLTSSSVPAVKGVVVKASSANSTGIIYVGKDNTVTAGTTAATDGFPLAAGDSITLPINNANLVWVIGSTTNLVAFFMAV